MGHGVRAVADDDALCPVGDLLADGDGQGLVLLGAHVLAEDTEEFLGGEVGDIRQFRHGSV